MLLVATHVYALAPGGNTGELSSMLARSVIQTLEEGRLLRSPGIAASATYSSSRGLHRVRQGVLSQLRRHLIPDRVCSSGKREIDQMETRDITAG